MDKITSTPYSMETFEIFDKFVELERIKRAGPLMHGVNGEAEARKFASDPNPRFPISHGQSVADHTLETITLNNIIHLRYLGLISRDVYVNANFALWQHDVPEYKNGDIPDDGTRPKSTDQTEAQILEAVLWDKLPIVYDVVFKSFQEAMDNETDICGRYCKMVDKFSLPLACLSYERQGHGGDVKAKEEYFRLSDQDKKAIEFTGSKLAADIFLYSTLEGHPKFFTHPCFKTFIELIQSAAVVVRGSEIEWLHRYLSTK